MPDPRFDGSLDAPTFIDRVVFCTDCDKPARHRNHDGRNENGHFFNAGEPQIRDRLVKPAIATPSPTRPPAPVRGTLCNDICPACEAPCRKLGRERICISTTCGLVSCVFSKGGRREQVIELLKSGRSIRETAAAFEGYRAEVRMRRTFNASRVVRVARRAFTAAAGIPDQRKDVKSGFTLGPNCQRVDYPTFHVALS